MTVLGKTTAVAVSVLCAFSAVANADDAEAFRTATTVEEIKALGAQQLVGKFIKKVLTGRTFETDEWTWTIGADGQHTSTAKDGSWTDNGRWDVKGNQYCRSSQATNGKTICSKVYVLDRDLRFGQAANPRKLLDWFVSF